MKFGLFYEHQLPRPYDAHPLVPPTPPCSMFLIPGS